ncbi:hypothetical protein DBV15_07388, partial [Temnothorax longispinosus]
INDTSTYTYPFVTPALICLKCTPTFGDSVRIKTQEPSRKSLQTISLVTCRGRDAYMRAMRVENTRERARQECRVPFDHSARKRPECSKIFTEPCFHKRPVAMAFG